jgi:protein TonB
MQSVSSEQDRPERYPARATRDRVSGFVTMRQQVSSTGSVTAARVVDAKPIGYFEETALRAAKSSQYEPFLAQGQPSCVVFNRTIMFELIVDEP